MPRYIDADALKAKYEQMIPEIGDGYHKETLQDVLFELEHAPTISPDEVRGVAKVNYDHGDYSCSACGNPARRLSFARKKFCDECGAKLLWEVSEDALS